MNTKILIILIVLIGLVVGGFFAWKSLFQSETLPQPPSGKVL